MATINGPLASVQAVYGRPLKPQDIRINLDYLNRQDFLDLDARIDMIYREALGNLGITPTNPINLTTDAAKRVREHMIGMRSWQEAYMRAMTYSDVTPSHRLERQMEAISNPWSSETAANFTSVRDEGGKLVIDVKLAHFFATQLNRAALLPDKQLDSASVYVITELSVEGGKPSAVYLGTRGGRTYVGGKTVVGSGGVRLMKHQDRFTVDPFVNAEAEVQEETGMKPSDYVLQGIIGRFWDEGISRNTNLVFLATTRHDEYTLRRKWEMNGHADKREHQGLEFPSLRVLPRLVKDQATLSHERPDSRRVYDPNRPLLAPATGALLTYMKWNGMLASDSEGVLESLSGNYEVLS
jgi:hypothetical protein